ncbi:T6SS immunity protein Tli3 family protein [Cupriavidus sp. H18C2]|uniref:T6SS immunity protein Tli3 family protein n=1 Tax=Cupriavidus sp. H18C2 TaxID=3241602 RepID=UPI003BF8CCAC
MIAYRHILGVFAIAAFFTTGCANPSSNRLEEMPSFDVPPQIIYRIDDQRFVSLEDYKHCYFGTTYYNDTRQGIRTKFGRGGGIASYRGRLINADPTGQNIVIPSSYPPNAACPDKGCNIAFIYSTDAGRTFLSGGYYMRDSPNPFRDSKDYIVAATTDRIYIARKWRTDDYYVTQYPLAPGIDLRPYRHGEPPRPEVKTTVRGERFSASQRPNYLDGLRTPSGQEYVSCDDSIRPANVSQ